jgi:hypothetical protein
VALVKPGRDVCWNRVRNSFNAMLYTRFVIGEETLSGTSVFSYSHPSSFSTTTRSVTFRSLLLGINGGYVMSTLPLGARHIKREGAPCGST